MAGSKGKLVVISAPSGTGKSTVCQRLLSSRDDVVFSVSYTTRLPRGSERDGLEYHFVDEATFDRMVAESAFLEWAEVHGRRYGSGRADTDRLLDQGKDVLFDIDVQGGQQIKRAAPDAVLIFLLPPSAKELVRRLKGRRTESEEGMNRRLASAEWELAQASGYDFHVVNDELEAAVAEVDRIRRGVYPEPSKRMALLDALIGDIASHRAAPSGAGGEG